MYRLMYRGSGRRFAEITPPKKKKEKKAREKSLPRRAPKRIEET